jgi:hypothetical protein
MRYKRDHTLNQARNNAEFGKNILSNFRDKTPTYELIFSIDGTYENSVQSVLIWLSLQSIC